MLKITLYSYQNNLFLLLKLYFVHTRKIHEYTHPSGAVNFMYISTGKQDKEVVTLAQHRDISQNISETLTLDFVVFGVTSCLALLLISNYIYLNRSLASTRKSGVL